MSRAATQPQTLKFWQFYAPGGGVATQDKWYEDVVKALMFPPLSCVSNA